jgi:integrase
MDDESAIMKATTELEVMIWRMIPDYGTVSMKGTQYYRTRVTDQQGRRVSLYARTREELYQKEQEAIQQIENKTYRRSTPTVEEYCEKWLLM